MTQAGVEAWACTTIAFAELSETVTPQGLAAIVPLPELPLPGAPTLALVLDGVQHLAGQAVRIHPDEDVAHPQGQRHEDHRS